MASAFEKILLHEALDLGTLFLGEILIEIVEIMQGHDTWYPPALWDVALELVRDMKEIEAPWCGIDILVPAMPAERVAVPDLRRAVVGVLYIGIGEFSQPLLQRTAVVGQPAVGVAQALLVDQDSLHRGDGVKWAERRVIGSLGWCASARHSAREHNPSACASRLLADVLSGRHRCKAL